jgi:hypothetical protein
MKKPVPRFTYCNDVVGIGAVEVGYPYAWWKRLLTFECLVETLAELWLDAQSLKHKHAHPHKALFGGVVALVNGIVKNQDHKVVSPVCVDNERSEPLVALQGFPEQHDHFRSPCQRLMAARQI